MFTSLFEPLKFPSLFTPLFPGVTGRTRDAKHDEEIAHQEALTRLREINGDRRVIGGLYW